MGLARAAIHLLIHEAARQPFSGSIATLGRQHVYATAAEVRSMADQLGVALREIPEELHREPSLARQQFVSDDWLLSSLGFDEVIRIDYSNYEQSEVILDLNESATPAELQARFDVVLDSGTIEHVFDIAAALRHCARMARRGGRVIHLTPTSNCVEHGFYSVSPTLFADFYSTSGFAIHRVWLCEIPLDLMRGQWQVYDYYGSPQRFISNGQLSDKIWFTFSVTSADELDLSKHPQQWFYQQTWSEADDAFVARTGATDVDTHFESGSRSAHLMQRLGWFPLLQRRLASTIRLWRSWKHSRDLATHKLPYPFVGRF